jgi:transcriptional regulator with XRE-family HTH domain
MKRKGISNSQLAKMTGRRPSEVTKWLGGGHNFTCKTIVLISNALGEDLIRVVKTKK